MRAQLSTLRGMSFGLARGRTLDAGAIGRTGADLPPLPDTPVDRGAARFDPRAWFEYSERPLEIEIGSGKGGYLVDAAKRQPETNLLGIEWAREFWLYAADRCRRHALANVQLLNADAVEFLKWRVPDGIADVIHLYYSDPWPKKKHHKRRVVRDEFLKEAHRVLKAGGELRIVTDHDEYWSWMEEHFARWCDAARPAPRFDRLDDASARERVRVSERDTELVATNYERKFTNEQKPPHATVLIKRT